MHPILVFRYSDVFVAPHSFLRRQSSISFSFFIRPLLYKRLLSCCIHSVIPVLPLFFFGISYHCHPCRNIFLLTRSSLCILRCAKQHYTVLVAHTRAFSFLFPALASFATFTSIHYKHDSLLATTSNRQTDWPVHDGVHPMVLGKECS